MQEDFPSSERMRSLIECPDFLSIADVEGAEMGIVRQKIETMMERRGAAGQASENQRQYDAMCDAW